MTETNLLQQSLGYSSVEEEPAAAESAVSTGG
jgi:hypothetical protein